MKTTQEVTPPAGEFNNPEMKKCRISIKRPVKGSYIYNRISPNDECLPPSPEDEGNADDAAVLKLLKSGKAYCGKKTCLRSDCIPKIEEGTLEIEKYVSSTIPLEGGKIGCVVTAIGYGKINCVCKEV